jgi:general secretion pathway protein K
MKNQKGVAILITLFAVMIMTFLAIEIAYNSQVEFAVGAAQLDRLRSYYLAKTGAEFSLLRIQVYKKALARFGSSLGAQKSALDLIWQFPFAWPPILPPEMSKFDKGNIDKAIQKSFIDGSFVTSIQSESGKIDLNDLGSPSESLRKSVNAQLVQIIQNRLDQDDDWAQEHRGKIRPQEIVNNIADWVSPGETSLNGGSKNSPYTSSSPSITPPSRSMKTPEELHMVKGITEDIYNLLLPRVTVWGAKAININTATSEVIQSIDKIITKEIAAKIIEHRGGDPAVVPGAGPFNSKDDFVKFLGTLGLNTQNFNQSPGVPLIFDSEFNFRIKSTGIYKHAQREIVAIVYDFDKVKGQLASALTSTSGSTSTTVSQTAVTTTVTGSVTTTTVSGSGSTSGPPTIVFWQEF